VLEPVGDLNHTPLASSLTVRAAPPPHGRANAKGLEVRERSLAGVLLIAGAILVHGFAYADIFRCIGADGEVLLTDSPCPAGTETAAVTPAAPASSVTVQKMFDQEELDRLLAPIALYPDALLAQILMASTYPLEVVEAARWVRAHPDLKGDPLQAAIQEQTWDPSVKGLVMVPQVLTMMDEKLDWTEKLGDAFLSQQQAVMDTVQNLRAKAQAAGHLTSTPQQTVTTEGEAIRVEPANPEVIYVPVYDPWLVYGPWWWPGPPYYWYPPGYFVPGPILYFGLGWYVGPAIWGHCDWRHRRVTIDVHHYNNFNHTHIVDPRWSHDIDHRRGVPYRDDATRRQYGRALSGAEARRDFRGYEQPLRIREPARPSQEQIRQELARPRAEQEKPRPPQPPAQTPRAPAAPGQFRPVPAPLTPAHPPAGERAAPAFETFGRGDAARAYSSRGAMSRGVPQSAAGRGAAGGHR